jgi:hypothetical protein
MIHWLTEHPLWTYPVTVKWPPDGEDMFHPTTPESEWVEREERIGGSFDECVSIEHAWVDPTLEWSWTEPDPRNTAFRVWIEAGGWNDLKDFEEEPPEGWNDQNRWEWGMDTRLSCGGDTLEEAFLNLASLVKFYYNDQTGALDEGLHRMDIDSCGGRIDPQTDEWISYCVDSGDGFCCQCGHLIRDHSLVGRDV